MDLIKIVGITLLLTFSLTSCGLFSTDYAENCYAKSSSGSSSNGGGEGSGGEVGDGIGSGSSSGSGSSEAGCSKTPVD